MNILLHICCGPCAIMPAMLLQEEGYAIRGYFNNPNIHPLAEYIKRREGAGQCAEKLSFPIEFEDDAWNLPRWLERQLPKAESRDRCNFCIASRLDATAKKASELNLPAFSTSLLYSRYQPHEFIAEAGKKVASRYGLEFIYRDFRTNWQEGIDISKVWELYRQQYCGCIFSETERYAKKFAQLKKI